jgi:hypothetical protein
MAQNEEVLKDKGDLPLVEPVIVSGTEPTDDDLLEQGPYVDGFTKKTILGALFVAFVMMPGSIYLGLVAGTSMGSAAEWVTIILFAELSRRSFTFMKRQEIYILFYVATSLATIALANLALAGGPFAGTIWMQYLLQSPQTNVIADQIPDWVVPPVDSPGIKDRDLTNIDWWYSASKGPLSAMSLICIGQVLGRMAWIGLGYVLFRLVSDGERLPFPLAPIAAEGATALAESTDREGGFIERRKKSWRWNVFSIGACLGIIFGLVYVCLPVISGLFMAKPIMLLPIPFVDFTSKVEGFLPASLVSISFDAGMFLAGMVLPFPLIVGAFTAVMLTGVFGNPILQALGFFPHWSPGNGVLVNSMLLSFDFWLSVQLGFAGAILIIGLWSMVKVFKSFKQPKNEEEDRRRAAIPGEPPYRTACKERGDFPIWVGLALFVTATACYCYLCHLLVPGFPIWIIVIFGFITTPLMSYVSARLVGMTGMGVAVPFLKETTFILSRYKGIDIWFAPIPLADYGGSTQRFRELELTRTKFTSIIKAELLMIPVSLVSSFLFWWLFWNMSQIPSESFPFASRTWPVQARQYYLILTANISEQPLLLQAIKGAYIMWSMGIGLVLFLVLGAIGIPVSFFYGMIGGLGAPLHGILPMFIGGMIGRYYFQKKFGQAHWARYVPVVAAGFACGMGLSAMLAVASAIVSQCTRELPF